MSHTTDISNQCFPHGIPIGIATNLLLPNAHLRTSGTLPCPYGQRLSLVN